MNREARVQLVGRSSSHFTRVAAIFAHELEVPFELSVVHDPMSLDAVVYAGHPGLKIPILRAGESVIFGTENICRRLTEMAGRENDPKVVFPEDVRADAGRCAQELVWQAMTTQVQLIVGTVFGGLPADNAYFEKAKVGLSGSLTWLDQQLAGVLSLLPEHRDLSVFEVSLFCLVEHLVFRPTVPIQTHASLLNFSSTFGLRASARKTAFRYDPMPSQEARSLRD